MNRLQFDFTVNKNTSTVYVKKEHAANLDLVWDAYTKPELLDQWWAPKPWLAKTKSMDFKAGGRRLYAMCGLEGEEHWALAEFYAHFDTEKDGVRVCEYEGKMIGFSPNAPSR